MSKITQYPQAMSFDEGDFLLKDGVNGTKIIAVDDAVDEISEKSGLNTLKTSFQNLDAGDVAYSDSDTYNSGTVGSEVSDLKSDIDDVDTCISESVSAADYETGKLAASSGQPGSSATNVVYNGTTISRYGVRSKGYLDNKLLYIKSKGDYYITLYAYDRTDNYAYVGWYTGSGFATGAISLTMQSVDLCGLYKTYPNYDYMVVIYNTVITTQITVSDTVTALQYFYKLAEDFKTLNTASYKTVYPKQLWINGKLSSSGQDGGTNTDMANIRTQQYIKIPTSEFTLTIGTGYKGKYGIYNSEKTFQGMSDNLNAGTYNITITPGYCIRLVGWNTSLSSISPLEGNNFVVSYREYLSEAMADVNDYSYDYATVSMFPKIGVIGDSFASGTLYDPVTKAFAVSNNDVSWPQVLARKSGSEFINFSFGGANTVSWLTDTSRGLPKLLDTEKQNLYIIDLGINDKTAIDGGTETLGTIDDVDTSDYTQNPNTFYGNYGRIIGNILAYAPNAKIIAMSVPRTGERTMDADIKAVANKYKIPFIQLTDDAYFTSELFAGSMVNEHPLAYGYSGMAQAIDKLLQKCIVDNLYYFREYTGIVT